VSDGDNDREVVLAPLPSAVVNTTLSWKQLALFGASRGMGLVDRLSRMVSSILKAEGGKAILSWWIITG